uniref:Inositol hexakisphosphate and diphosphoinositol-pentakisphosphate kinase n=1 Tax=Aceria tosichella TaxID=561515 RepID=A0A6G1SA12_9ACAR
MFARPFRFQDESGAVNEAGHEDRPHFDDVDFDYDDEEDDNNQQADEQEEDIGYDPHKQVIVGICAMEKKAQSKPMKEILRRLEDYFEYIRTLVFDESVILNKPVEEWPLCDCLISFHSKGFALSKAIEYARLRKPFLINDLDIQYDIQDRRKVYKILEEADIELPRYAVLDRDSANPEDRELIESDDHIEVAKVVFNKPFVEKPISAEDHNICIYYPAHAGGGSQRLFRKIGCRSSVYSNESHVRKTGSYIYEEFMPTDGTDVKVYTAGPDYAHAEARKSPALDGKVERDSDGKEIRYPVILTNKEKLIARKVCLAFKQAICGFDLLRANGRSYVCDVNGFSFVKSSMKYYEDCSKIIGNMVLRALAPQLHIPWSIPFQLDDPPIVPTTFGRMMELRCVIAVIRHGDRTPKQKMKLEVKHPRFFELFHKYGDAKNGQAKLKKPQQLQEVLDIARYLLGELPDKPASDEVVEPRVKLKQLKSVLEMYGHFSGINRKVQLKYQPHGRPRRSSSEDEGARGPSLVLILKWGGELTPAGRVQAEDLGRCFRRLYPASGDYSGPQGLGLLRLHSTFRHDLKIYASDEGRVQMTAAAFAKGFLALEGELTPILFQMVKSANTNGLLDNDCESSKCQKLVKERLHDIMQKNQDLTPEDMAILNPTGSPAINAACKFIGNPYQACEKMHKHIKELNALIRSKRQDNSYTQEYHLYHGETWDLLQRRWAKLEKDFKFPKTKRFDISKIPDIYDCIKYDLQHNQHTLQFQHAHELHTYAKALADIVIPQEYGLSDQEKLMISLGTCSPLLKKIQADLLRNADSSNGDDETESVNRLDPKYSHGVSSPDRHVRTRLYFTSESHIHSLVTALQYGGLLDVKRDEQWQRSMEFLSAISELNYLSQIVIMLYEDPTKEPTSDDRFHVEIHFSSGVINRICQQTNMPNEPQGPGFRPHLHNKSFSNASSTGSEQKSPETNASTLASSTTTRITESTTQSEEVAMSVDSSQDSSQQITANNNQESHQNQPTTKAATATTITTTATTTTTTTTTTTAAATTTTATTTITNAQNQLQPQQAQQISSTPPKPISLRNNWKAYEQYLASEWTNSPHMQRFARRHCNYSDHLNLPPTYHTIHHLNFSPSTLNALAESTTSISISTSPNTRPPGPSLQQHFNPHKQQHHSHPNTGMPTTGPKMLGHYATMSASMPIHYKSSQNPRACSVADVSQYCGGPSSLISTAVISGSSPELVAVCPYSPSIRPLETLHNELSLRQFIDFIARLTQNLKISN